MGMSLIESWSNHTYICFSLVNAFGLNGQGSKAVDLYTNMPNPMRNEITHTSVLNACSHSGLLNEARLIFEKIVPKTANSTTAMVSQSDLSLQQVSCSYSLSLSLRSIA